MECGLIFEPYIYDFHHRDPAKKDLSIAKTYKSFEKMKEELLKCDLLCANCHREKHYKS